MMKIEVNNPGSVPTNFDIATFVENILKEKQISEAQLEITLMNDEEIQGLNKQHLNHDFPTDIITFDLSDGQGLVGECYIGMEEAERNAQELKTTTDDELKILLIHGILHLLDYSDKTQEDQKIMFREQDRLFQKLHAHP